MSQPSDTDLDRWLAEHGPRRAPRFAMLDPHVELIRRLPHVAIDTDNENSTLTRFHPEARFIDLDAPRQLDGLFSATASADLIVVDGRAASTDLFLGYFEEITLAEVLAACDAALTLAIPINHEADSVDQLQRLVERLGPLCRYVVIRNAAHSDAFAIYDQSEVRARLRDELGGCEIILPRLQDWLVETLHREDLTIAAGTRHSAFSLLDRQRLRNWERRFHAALDAAGELLLPPAPGPVHTAAQPEKGEPHD